MACNKLVRDKIPEIIERQGKTPVIRVLEGEEYTCYLERKLDEEVGEFHKDKTLEELADILEVVYAQTENLGFTKENLHAIYEKKHEKRGGFQDRVFLISKEG